MGRVHLYLGALASLPNVTGNWISMRVDGGTRRAATGSAAWSGATEARTRSSGRTPALRGRASRSATAATFGPMGEILVTLGIRGGEV